MSKRVAIESSQTPSALHVQLLVCTVLLLYEYSGIDYYTSVFAFSVSSLRRLVLVLDSVCNCTGHNFESTFTAFPRLERPQHAKYLLLFSKLLYLKLNH